MGSFYIGWYWAVALVGGYLLTLLWYRRHAGRAGVWTPARGYLITGVVLTVLVAGHPAAHHAGCLPRFVVWLPFGDVWIRGTLAFLIIAIGLWVLARAERSRVLAVIALVYTGAALLSSLYNVENIVFRLGWNPGRSAFAWQLTALPNILLPAAILLVAGCGAFLAQRTGGARRERRRRPGPGRPGEPAPSSQRRPARARTRPTGSTTRSTSGTGSASSPSPPRRGPSSATCATRSASLPAICRGT